MLSIPNRITMILYCIVLVAEVGVVTKVCVSMKAISLISYNPLLLIWIND